MRVGGCVCDMGEGGQNEIKSRRAVMYSSESTVNDIVSHLRKLLRK